MVVLKEFLKELGGEMIIKPLDGCGGAGVFHLHSGDRNLNSILEFATDQGRRRVMAQRYLPEVRIGDKRIILVDGEPKGAVLRVPDDLESRSNFHVGGSAARSPLTERDREICAAIAPRLRADGLVFVGLDVIGGYLTEINVTSPTGVQEINALENVASKPTSSTGSKRTHRRVEARLRLSSPRLPRRSRLRVGPRLLRRRPARRARPRARSGRGRDPSQPGTRAMVPALAANAAT
jgi:hypothetical protein